MRKFKKGAASFYVVAISTLILVIIAASFAGLIVSEVTRTSNDDLSQSAYDAAMAGVEDAKLAFMNYQECTKEATPSQKLIGKNQISCQDIISWVENSNGECDMVANILGRPIVDKDGNDVTNSMNEEEKVGVLVQEGTNNDNAMSQYYTCTKISGKTSDYLGTLTTENLHRSTRVIFDKNWGADKSVNPYQDVDMVRVSWHPFSGNMESGNTGQLFKWAKVNEDGAFDPTEVIPGMLTFSLTQTGNNFDLGQFNTAEGDQTNRGTLYFIPVDTGNYSDDAENYISLVNGEGNKTVDMVDSGDGSGAMVNALVKSNNKNYKNKPFLVWCDKDGSQDYACSVDIKLPKPIGGTRNEKTFIVDVGTTYAEPKTDYRLEFFSSKEGNQTPITLDGVQISIDSTGKASDLYRRVDTRLETSNSSYPVPMFGVETLQSKNLVDIEMTENETGGEDPGIVKDVETMCEWNFHDLTCQ